MITATMGVENMLGAKSFSDINIHIFILGVDIADVGEMNK